MTEHKCEDCKRFFQSQEGLDSHIKDKHNIGSVDQKSRKINWHVYVIAGVIILIIIGLAIFFLMQPKSNDQPKYNRELPKTGFHWHPKLNIYIKGQLVTIPTGVGLYPVERPIHIHDTDNVLHYEFGSAPTYEQIRLGNFFRIWGKTFNKTCIFEYCNGENGTVKFYVNGVENSYFDDYIPSDLELLEIKYE